MAVRGMVFDVEVNTATGEAALRRFGNVTQAEMKRAEVSTLAMAESFRKVDSRFKQFREMLLSPSGIIGSLALLSFAIVKLTGQIQGLGDYIKGPWREVGRAFQETVGASMTRSLKEATEQGGHYRSVIIQIAIAFAELGSIFERIYNSNISQFFLAGLDIYIEQKIQQLQGLNILFKNALGGEDGEFAKMADRLRAIQNAPAGATLATGGGTGAGGTAGVSSTSRTMTVQNAPTRMDAQQIGYGIDQLFAMRDEVPILNAAMNDLTEAFQAGFISNEQYAAGIAMINERALELRKMGLGGFTFEVVDATSAAQEGVQANYAYAQSFEMIAGALSNAAGGMLAYAIAGGKANISLGQILTTVAQQAFALSLMHVAMGIAGKLNPMAQAMYGPPATNFASAKIFAVAGVGLALAARLAGGPGAQQQGGGGGEGGSGAAPVAPESAGRGPQVTVVFEGTVFGDVGEDAARAVVRAIEKQQSRVGR